MATVNPAFTFLPLGAIIQEFIVDGHNIVQGFKTQEDYVQYNSPFFGATIGRVANRVKDAKLPVNGQIYNLVANEGSNSLHGGAKGWDKRIFEGPTPVNRNGTEAVLFKYLSKDGEEGYPGTVEIRVWYSAKEEDGKKVLDIEYEVELVGDEASETSVNVTNHSYYNLSGGPTIEGTIARLYTDKHLPLDEASIPLGHVDTLPNVKVDEPLILGRPETDFDHCLVVETDPSKIPLDTRPGPLRKLASFTHPDTSLHLEVYSTEPAFQFYTGKWIDVPEVNGVPARGKGAGFCVEPSRYVNAPNVPEWKHTTTLKKGEVWGSRTVLKAWKGN
ncbi:hypothetical protein VTN31DRAFT_7426 [Thermomyces dupontii]|uniref:uncharacterized protein n=1 Tax=Talaromyces thermophilus TaxID=28565 RepID=UPI0037444441